MALVLAGVEPWQHMPAPHRSAPSTRPHGSARRELIRVLAVVLSVVALVLTSSALNWVTEASAADGVPDQPKKAVIVSGPVHSRTEAYRDYAIAIADAAEAQGMDVKRILHPNATTSRVIHHANGADLFVYVGHGNGWPSPYGPFQEDTKNGLGLNPDDPEMRTTGNVRYKGANWMRENIELAPNAVVILSHLSYASGNASSGMPIPSRSVAIERIDNFANGFLSIGARVVWALGWQPGADVVKALHQENASMDAVFMTRYRSGVNPLNGWIGHNPGYYDSVRIPGARIHIDPDPGYGYLRGLTGDLGFTTTEWRQTGTLPDDTVPPVISSVSARQDAVTLTAANSVVPVFTPNSDGLSDTIKISYNLTENAFIGMEFKQHGKVIGERSRWALRGNGSFTWDGRRDSGSLVGDGKVRITLTPTDRAGNEGESVLVAVKVLNAMKAPTVSPRMFYSADGDEVAQSSTLRATILRDATASWTIYDKNGTAVRHGPESDVSPGKFSFVWDGANDAGAQVRDGKYRARIRITRSRGTYAHQVMVRMTSFSLGASRWTLRRGGATTLYIESAEPLKGKPVVTANQRGIPLFTVSPNRITWISNTQFKVKLKTRNKGKPGDLKLRITGYDKRGGSQDRLFHLTLR